MDDFGNQIGASMPGVPRLNLVAFHRFNLSGLDGVESDRTLHFYGLIDATPRVRSVEKAPIPATGNSWPFGESNG
ncbi:hypothetical protein [Cupriavidus sp. TKC]|uniref:hypothetical protein n=1 Tax=Cupriavidus sp. TKC TaxID=2880159 RepID=UPI00295E952E|nr:hypothetical protein [Cupriavidus sp. TKC]